MTVSGGGTPFNTQSTVLIRLNTLFEFLGGVRTNKVVSKFKLFLLRRRLSH